MLILVKASADADAVSDFDEEEDEDYDEESEESDEEQLTYAAYIRMEVPRTNYNSFGVEYETKDGRLGMLSTQPEYCIIS